MATFIESPRVQRVPVAPTVSYHVEEVSEPRAVETVAPGDSSSPASSSGDVRARVVALLGAGLSDAETGQKLVDEFGMKPLAASRIVEEVHTAEDPHNGASDMFAGALWCIGGIVVTVATYEAAGPGDTFIIAWGAILFGAFQFFKGLLSVSGSNG